MTPEIAAEGKRLLEEHSGKNPIRGSGPELVRWLWANREELVRCAEERAAQIRYANEPDGYDTPENER